ncbi:unnamed protein product, partial [Polarella glacialis]
MQVRVAILPGSLADVVRNGTVADLLGHLSFSSDRQSSEALDARLLCLAAEREDRDAVDICHFLMGRAGLQPDTPNVYLQSPLFFAARTGGASCVLQFLLARKADANRRDCNMQTPIFYAARYGKAENLRLLLAAQGDPTTVDSNGQTAVFLAAMHSAPSCVELLLNGAPQSDNNNNTNNNNSNNDNSNKNNNLSLLADSRDRWGRTALFYARGDCLCLLLKSGGSPHSSDVDGQTALFSAARNGDTAAAELLLDSQAEVDRVDSSGKTALFWAAEAGHAGMCRLLLEKGADAFLQDEAGQSPADVADSIRDAKLRDATAEAFTQLRRPCSTGAACCSFDCLKQVVVSGPEEQVRDLLLRSPTAVELARSQDEKSGRTLLFEAAARRNGTGSSGGADVALAVCQLLLQEVGVDVHARCLAQHTALFEAAAVGNAKVCRYLAQRGCDVNAGDSFGRTALFSAASCGSEQSVRALLDFRADVGHRCRAGQTPLFFAVTADNNSSNNNSSNNIDCADALLGANADVGAQDVKGQTALFLAAGAGHEAAARMLLQARASLDILDRKGRSALFYAIQQTRVSTALLLLDAEGGTAVHSSLVPKMSYMALQRGLPEIASLLVPCEDRSGSGSSSRDLLHPPLRGRPPKLACEDPDHA